MNLLARLQKIHSMLKEHSATDMGKIIVFHTRQIVSLHGVYPRWLGGHSCSGGGRNAAVGAQWQGRGPPTDTARTVSSGDGEWAPTMDQQPPAGATGSGSQRQSWTACRPVAGWQLLTRVHMHPHHPRLYPSFKCKMQLGLNYWASKLLRDCYFNKRRIKVPPLHFSGSSNMLMQVRLRDCCLRPSLTITPK